MKFLTTLLLTLVTVGATFFVGPKASAEKLDLMRRWVIFPFDTDKDKELKSAAENAWWKFRERLTADRKYLVASRQYMIQKDAFQPRKELTPDEVKLLAHLLDADVIVTGFSEHRQFQLNVYLAQNGALFWTKHLAFHPSLRAPDQLELVSDNLTKELLAQIPYHAFTVIDPLIGKPVYEEDKHKYAVVDVGNSDDIAIGSEIQWVNITLPTPKASENKNTEPLIADEKIAVIGEGKVVKLRRGVVVAELLKAQNVDAISEKSMVRFPAMGGKSSTYVADDTTRERLAPEMIPTLMSPVTPESAGQRRTTLIITSIVSVLGIVALGL